MRNNYILIDYENVPLDDISEIKNHSFKVLVFIGANQAKLPFEFVSTLQTLGENAEYIKISGNGSNALDFHIAFYIGQLAERDKSAYFHIISNDTGFDPLITHLKAKKIGIQRSKHVSEIPVLQTLNQEQKIQNLVKHLESRGNARPRTVQSLTNTIQHLFKKQQLNEQELTSLVQQLDKLRYISVNDTNVSYNVGRLQQKH